MVVFQISNVYVILFAIPLLSAPRHKFFLKQSKIYSQAWIKRNLYQVRIQRREKGTLAPPKKKRERERERGASSVPLLSISAFIYSPVKCNKSFYIFTRSIALLVYLTTFKVLKQSTINQKTKRYYNPLDLNFIKIHPFDKHFNTNYPIFNRKTWENWLI